MIGLKRWIVLVVLAGCVDTLPPLPECDAGAPFDGLTALGELAQPGSSEANLTLDPATENRAFFASVRANGASAVFTAERENRGGTFSPPALISGVTLPHATTRIQLTRDERTMVVTADGIYVARRAKPNDGFVAPVKLAVKHDGRDATPTCSSIDPEGTMLFYSDGGEIFQQPLAEPLVPSTRIAELTGYACLVVSADGKEGFVRGVDGLVYRTTHDATWSRPVLEVALSPAGEQTTVTYLSRNRCDAYVINNVAGANHAYWAHRAPR